MLQYLRGVVTPARVCSFCLSAEQHAHTNSLLRLVGSVSASKKPFAKKHYRDFSTKKEVSYLKQSTKLKIKTSKATAGASDIFGPPDPVSNIQAVQFYIPPDETETEKKFRIQRTEVLQWNHQFWARHNTKFSKEKAEFVKNITPSEKRSTTVKKSTPAEQMSVFYRQFLNENRDEHLRYNKEWYKKNLSLLWPAFLVFLIRMRRRLLSSKVKQ